MSAPMYRYVGSENPMYRYALTLSAQFPSEGVIADGHYSMYERYHRED